MVAGTLEEYGHVEAGIIDSEGESVLEVRQAVTDDLAVSRIVDGIRTDADDPITIDVFVLQVTGLPDATGDLSVHIGEIHTGGICSCLLICLEEVISHEAPDLTDLLAHIVALRESLFLVLELGDLGIVVTQGRAEVVAEWSSAQHYLVLPCQGKFVSLGAEVGGVLLRRCGSVYRREFDTVRKHVLGVTDVSLSGELEAAVEHIQIETCVVLD